MELTKAEQRILKDGKSWPLWQSVAVGLSVPFLIIIGLKLVPDEELFWVPMGFIFVLMFYFLWERYITSGLIAKLQERIFELETTSRQKN